MPAPPAAFPAQPPPDFSDHIFKNFSGINLELRLWPAPSATLRSGWVIWIHGGANLAGQHYAPSSWVVQGFRSIGLHVVSTSYRLSPQADMEQQLQDCLDAVQWSRQRLPGVLSGQVDVDKLVVAGGSAGGALATFIALQTSPPPAAVVNVYGAVDMLAIRKLDLADRQAAQAGSSNYWLKKWASDKYSHESNIDALRDRSPSDTLIAAPLASEPHVYTEKATRDRWRCDSITYSDRILFQSQLTSWCRNYGYWTDAVMHLDDLENDQAREEKCQLWSALYHLNRTTKFPPTAFLHGTADTAVPLDQSLRMAARLREMDVEVLERYQPGVGHSFDQAFTGPEVDGWDEYVQPILDFVDGRLKSFYVKV